MLLNKGNYVLLALLIWGTHSFSRLASCRCLLYAIIAFLFSLPFLPAGLFRNSTIIFQVLFPAPLALPHFPHGPFQRTCLRVLLCGKAMCQKTILQICKQALVMPARGLLCFENLPAQRISNLKLKSPCVKQGHRLSCGGQLTLFIIVWYLCIKPALPT